MFLNSGLPFLAIMFLTKYAAASDCSTIASRDFNSRSSLGYYGNEIYKCFATNIINNGRKVLINVQEELSAMHQKTTKTLELNTDIDEFLSKYKAWEKNRILEKRFQLMNVAFDALVKLINKYDAALIPNPSEEDTNITQLLVRNSLDVFDQLYMEGLEILIAQIFKAVDSYLRSIQRLLLGNESDLVKWMERFQNAPTAQNRWEVFTTFFEMFVMRLSFEKGDLNSPPVSFRVVNKDDI